MPRLNTEQVEALKKKHNIKSVYEISCEDKYGYLRNPDRKTMAIASGLQANPIRSNEALMKGCWLEGDDELMNNDEYFLSVQGQLGVLMEGKAVEIVKL